MSAFCLAWSLLMINGIIQAHYFESEGKSTLPISWPQRHMQIWKSVFTTIPFLNQLT